MNRRRLVIASFGIAIWPQIIVAGEKLGEGMGLFDRSVPLAKQLESLKECGIATNDGVLESDLVAFQSKREMESKPYQGIIEVLGIELERKPYTPIANSLWMCDFERIEDHGDYQSIIERLELMTGAALGLRDVADSVDLETGSAWVSFTYKGKQIRWEAEVNDDWMDPSIIVKYDRLLKEGNVSRRIYSNHTDFGQSALFAAFTAQQFKCFQKHSKIRLALIEQ